MRFTHYTTEVSQSGSCIRKRSAIMDVDKMRMQKEEIHPQTRAFEVHTFVHHPPYLLQP